MRRWLCLLLAAAMLLSLAACKKDKKNESDDDVATSDEALTDPGTDASDDRENTGHEVLDLDFIEDFDQSPVMEEEQTVYDKDNILITATGLKYNPADGPQILLTVKNRSDYDLTIQNDMMIVNGYMIRPLTDIHAARRKTLKNQPITLTYLTLAMADIHTLKEVAFSLRLIDGKTSELIDTTEMIELELDDTSDKKQRYPSGGQTAFSDKNIKVTLNGIKNDNLFDSRYVLLVSMYNGTDQTISVGNNKLSVNGYAITHTMQTVIPPKTHAVDVIELFDAELDAKGIETLETVDVSFRLFYYDNWKPIAQTDMIPLQL